MKRVFVLFLAAFMLFGMTACSSKWTTYRVPQSDSYQFADSSKKYGYKNEVPYMSINKKTADGGTVSYALSDVYIFINDVEGEDLPVIDKVTIINGNEERKGRVYNKALVYNNEKGDKITAYRFNIDLSYYYYEGYTTIYQSTEVFIDFDFEISIEYKHKIPNAETKTFNYVFKMNNFNP